MPTIIVLLHNTISSLFVLRTEFVEAMLAKHHDDDLMAFIPPNAGGLLGTRVLSGPRTASFPGACHESLLDYLPSWYL